MIAQGVFAVFGMLFTITCRKIVIKWSRTAAGADSILPDFVTAKAGWSAVQGVSACNIQKRLGGQDDVFPHCDGPKHGLQGEGL